MNSSPVGADVVPRVDIAFRLTANLIPRDHGYALFGALGRLLGDLHGARWLAVHPIAGAPRPDGLLAIHPQRGELCLRVEPAEIPRVLPLSGKHLDIEGHAAKAGAASVRALAPAHALAARIVVIKGFTEAEPFRAAVERQLSSLGVRARVEIGRRRVLNVAGDTVVGFQTTLHELDDEGSLKVQSAGVGGRQRMGCGVFVPVRGR
jgi:CRISPR-associated protein Cas6